MHHKQARILNGYKVIYEPDHPSAMKNSNWRGYVYEHIFVVEKTLGRCLRDDEVIHHLDGNRMNNRQSNLIVLLRSQHMKLEMWLAKGAPYRQLYGENRVKSGKSTAEEPKLCAICGKTLQFKQKYYCSDQCAKFGRRKTIRPNREQLEREIQTMSWLAIGRKYGVSDNAIRKWAKLYNLL